MKLLKKIISLLIITLTLIGITGCDKMTDLGIPTSKRFPNGNVARCVWDLKVYNGNVYVGMGDYDSNTGPTDIWAYNLKKKKWENTATVKDETISRFIEIDGKLYAPGIDPMEDWKLGNYYLLENGKWETIRELPSAIHTFDIIKFENKLMFGVGARFDFPVLYTEDGENYNYIKFYKNYKNNEPYTWEGDDYTRGYEFLNFNNDLYVLTYHYHAKPKKASASLFKYNPTDNIFDYFGDGKSFYKFSTMTSVNILNSKGSYKGKYFYVSDSLYYTEDMIEFTKAEVPNDAFASQFKIYNEKMYILSYVKNEDGSYKTTIYSTPNGVSDYQEVYSFNFNVPPISFDIYKNTAYIGMGDRFAVNEKNGTVLKIKI